MLFFNQKKFIKNSEKLSSICKELIESYEEHEMHPSCLNDLMLYVKNTINAASQEIMHWNITTTEYITVANKLLAHGSFDLLASGKYHIYRGQLNFMSCAPNLMSVYNKSMEYAVKNNFIDEETKKDQYNYLIECLGQIG